MTSHMIKHLRPFKFLHNVLSDQTGTGEGLGMS